MKKIYFLLLLLFMVGSICGAQQISRELKVITPGTLATLAGSDKTKITDLTLTGTINTADFQTIREMSVLKNLNLSNVNLVNDLLPNNAFYGYKGHVTLPENLTKINTYSFSYFSGSVTLPPALEIIAGRAFTDCTLDKLDFSKCTELNTISAGAFAGLKLAPGEILDFSKNLKLNSFPVENGSGAFSFYKGHVTLPENLTKINTYSFTYFSGSVTLPPALEIIAGRAFTDCTLDKLDFSKCTELNTISAGAFAGLKLAPGEILDFSKNLKLNSFPVENGAGAFFGYKGHVTLPENLTKINTYSFTYFSGSVTLPPALEIIAGRAFHNSTLDKLDFSKCTELNTISAGAFAGLKLAPGEILDFSKNLKLNSFPVENGAGAFFGYTGHVTLPENLTKINTYSFTYFSGSVTLPPALEIIAGRAFHNSTLDKLDFSKCTELNTISAGAFAGLKLAPGEILDFSKNLKLNSFPVENGAGAFFGYKGHVTLPENLTKINTYSFTYFSGSVTLPPALEIIAGRAFHNSTLDKLDFSKCTELNTISAGAFAGLKLSSGEILDFSKNLKLNSFPVENGAGAFFGYKGHVTLPENLTKINTYSFTYFSGSVTLPPALEIIAGRAFHNSTLDKLDFSKCTELNTISPKAFEALKLSSGEILDFSKNLKLNSFPVENGAGAFFGYTGHVTLPENLTKINTYSFTYFSGSVTLPPALEIITDRAFYLSSIKEIALPATVTNIGNSAFEGNTVMQKLISHNPVPPVLGTAVFKGINTDTTELIADICSYSRVNQWKDFLKNIDVSNCDTYGIGADLAPNSYIFDIDKANNENIGGLYIPVKKAFAVWEKNDFFGQPIPEGILTTSLQWEDVIGLVEKVEITNPDRKEQAKIKVIVDKRKGKGNAVIALHVGPKGNSSDPVYWSWHVWVTDDPTKNAKTLNNNTVGQTKMISTFMDRNLGALSSSFLENDWGRSGGLMYQWGRKDPFPSFLYLDGYAPEIHAGKNGSINRWNYSSVMRLDRPYYSEVEKNIQASVQNPIKFFSPLKEEYTKNYDSETKKYLATAGNVSWLAHDISVNNLGKALDLWGDNWGGDPKDGGRKVDQAQKSPFDPCPSGWKIPSYATQTTYDRYNASPWGRYPTTQHMQGGSLIRTEPFGKELDLQPFVYYIKNGTVRIEEPAILPVEKYPKIKIYPGLGFDFSNVPDYDIGVMPLAGHYVGYYGYSSRGLTFQDQASELGLWGATLEKDGWAKMFGFSASNFEKGLGRYWLIPEGMGAGITYSLNAVRCIKQDREDTVLFNTEYIPEEKTYYNEGLQNPNTYLLTNSTHIQEISIPVNKAFAVYNQYLTDGELPQGNLSANVYWTTNTSLIKNVDVDNTQGSKENSQIKVQVNPNQTGNAVVSLHVGNNKNSGDKVLWSWHIWVTKNQVKSQVYTTEKKFSDSQEKLLDYEKFLVYETTSGSSPVTTEFMDRDLGALDYDITKTDFVGMHYQWGRKDPIPNFIRKSGESYTIYLGSTSTGKQKYTLMTSSEYDTGYTGYKKFDSKQKAMEYITQNPLSFVKDEENTWLPYALLNNGNQLWGKGIEKSPFDPCPEEWRIPEGGYSAPASPWYKEGTYYFGNDSFHPNVEDKKNNVKDGKKLSNYIDESGIIRSAGFIFSKPDYNLGMYPATGYRGLAKGKYNISGVGRELTLWTASLANFNVNNPNKYSSAHGFYAKEDYIDPLDITAIGVGKAVRCVKDTRKNSSSRTISQIRQISVANDIESFSESQIQIYPNPNSGVFSISLGEISEGTIQIVNTSGGVVFSRNIQGTAEIEVNIQNQPAGIYVVRVVSGQQIISKKIIKI